MRPVITIGILVVIAKVFVACSSIHTPAVSMRNAGRIENDDRFCGTQRSFPQRYCQMRSTRYVEDRTHEWDGRPNAKAALEYLAQLEQEEDDD